MSNKPEKVIEPLTPDKVRHLTLDQWNDAVADAKATVKKSIAQPDFEQFVSTAVSELPRKVSYPMLGGLILLALGALIVSAGKQFATTDLVFGDLVKVTNRIGPDWVNWVLWIILACGELGSLAFGLAAGIFAADKWGARIFRFFSVASASLAILSNITITVAHPEPEALLVQWLITLLLPSFILGVGFFCERLLLTQIDARREAIRKYNDANAEWLAAQTKPEAHKTYKNVLIRTVLDRLRTVQAIQNAKAWSLAMENKALRAEIFMREYRLHGIEFDGVELDEDGNLNPSVPSPSDNRQLGEGKQPEALPSVTPVPQSPRQLGFSAMATQDQP